LGWLCAWEALSEGNVTANVERELIAHAAQAVRELLDLTTILAIKKTGYQFSSSIEVNVSNIRS
jgi:hypothetical protein